VSDAKPPERQRRQARDREHSVDRRRVSEESKRRAAEAIRHDDPAAALGVLFEVLTGDDVAAHPSVRPVYGRVRVADSVDLAAERTLVVAVRVGDTDARAFVGSDDRGGVYRCREVSHGTHRVAATAVEVRETDPETLAVTRYAVDEASVVTAADSVTVDVTETPLGDAVTGPSMTVESLTIGDEITEDA
jgi:hypothetical protein